MAGTLQPLDQKFAIVDERGNPTEYFIRWAQQKQIDIGDSITLSDLQDYLTAHTLVEGSGIQFTPNGDINNSPTIAADVQEILDQVTATRGAILYRGLLGWTALLPGVALQLLQTNGAGADPSWVNPPASGGGVTTFAEPGGLLTTSGAGSVNFYLMRLAIAPDNIAINKVAFMCGVATATTRYQPFIYVCNALGVPGALVASGPQVIGSLLGYNEAPLSAPANLTKGNFYYIGVSVITANIGSLYFVANGVGAFAANGGSSVPSNPAPAVTTGGSALYGFWGHT